MASHTPAGGAGAPSPSAENSGTSIYDSDGNLLEQYAVTFDVINEIYKNMEEELGKELDLSTSVHFYLKGGNSLPFLQLPKLLPTPHPPIPNTFPSDFDFTLAVYPFLEVDEYNALLENSIDIILKSITRVIQDYCKKAELSTSVLEQCIKVHDYGDVIIPVHETLEGLIDKASTHKAFKCPKTCPFSIHIRKNVLFNYIPTNMGVIALKYKLHTGKIIDLLDISYFMRKKSKHNVFKKVDKTLQRDWDITMLEHYEFTEPVPLRIDVYDALTAYVNHYFAIKGNTRKNKIEKRTKRMNTLKNIVKSRKNTKKMRKRINGLKSKLHRELARSSNKFNNTILHNLNK